VSQLAWLDGDAGQRTGFWGLTDTHPFFDVNTRSAWVCALLLGRGRDQHPKGGDIVPENGQNRGRLRTKRVWISARGDGELGSLCEELLAAKIHLFRYRTVLRDPTGNSIVTILAQAHFYKSNRVSTFPLPTAQEMRRWPSVSPQRRLPHWHRRVRRAQAHFGPLYTNNEFGSYGRAMVFCPLHRSLPYVVGFLAQPHATGSRRRGMLNHSGRR
jgi:hypothetical protein